jgi:hypothetical protein
MKPELTPWFPTSINPGKIGEYEYRYEHGYQFRAYWSGKIWLIHDLAKGNLYYWGHPVGASGHWRGLAEDPAKAKP